MTISVAKEIINTIKFIMPVQKPKGTVRQRYCLISNGWIVAADDYMCIASPINMSINSAPNTHQLRAVLAKCGEDLSITELDKESIAVTSGALRAVVKCVLPAQLDLKAPDPITWVVDDSLKVALKAAESLAEENTNKPELGAVKLADMCCYGAVPMGTAAIQAFHGFSIPGTHLIPKAAAKAVCATKLALVGIGASDNSITFHFGNGAFIKTALHAGNFPVFEHLFETQQVATQIPSDFYSGLAAITPFSEEGFVIFKQGVMTSKNLENKPSTYAIEGMGQDYGLDIKLLLKVKANFKNIILEEKQVIFYNENMRGVIAKAVERNVE